MPNHHYLTPGQRVPGYLPYKKPVSNGNIPIPNEAPMFWPQGQFAPEFFPAGHPSFEPFQFPDGSAQILFHKGNGDNEGDGAYAGGDLDFDTEADRKKALKGYAIIFVAAFSLGAMGMHFYMSEYGK